MEATVASGTCASSNIVITVFRIEWNTNRLSVYWSFFRSRWNALRKPTLLGLAWAHVSPHGTAGLGNGNLRGAGLVQLAFAETHFRGWVRDRQSARRWPGTIGLHGDSLSGVGWGFAVTAGLAGQGSLKNARDKSEPRAKLPTDLPK